MLAAREKESLLHCQSKLFVDAGGKIEARCLAFFSSAAAAAVSKYHFNANFELMLPLARSLARSLSPYHIV